MVDTVIVALPAEDDYVNRLSSQTKPHLTLLYLGEEFDENSLENVARYIKHIAETSMHRFGLSVDRRGTLGVKDADVLFFDKGWQTKELKTVIGYLLADDAISLAYNQLKSKFPDWIPHLTMGYPEEPAKEDTREYPGIHYVNFDRIAIWTGDSEGPEFRLKDYEMCEDIAMSDEAAVGASFIEALLNQDDLEHHGVKGMQWGKHKADAGAGGSPKAAKVKKERGALRRGATKANTAFTAGSEVISKGHSKLIFMPEEKRDQISNATIMGALGAAKSINKSPQFKGKDIKRDPKLMKAYHDQVAAATKIVYQEQLAKARIEVAGDVISAAIDSRRQRLDVKSRRESARHADDDGLDTVLSMSFTEDNLGQIAAFQAVGSKVKHFDEVQDVLAHHGLDAIEIEEADGLFKMVVDEELLHSEEFAEFVLGEDFELMHYGVPGMQWGVRRTRTATGVEIKTSPGKKVKTKGGKFEEPHEDAKKAAVIKQKAKSSSTDSLSNTELKQLIERMNLEASYDRLAKQSVGNEIVKRLFTDPKYRNRQIEDLSKITMPVRLGAGAALGVGNTIRKTDLSDIGR